MLKKQKCVAMHVDRTKKITGLVLLILIAGLQGSGKTTFSAKLANYLKSKKGRNPILVAGDVYRPAAIKQLQQQLAPCRFGSAAQDHRHRRPVADSRLSPYADTDFLDDRHSGIGGW